MYPERIVCLTQETTETLYLLQEDWRIVGISAFTDRPAKAREEKQVVSTFTTGKIGEIVDLRPDLVLGFSDIQADIASQLIRAGIEVHVFNFHDVAGILRMVRTVGALVGCTDEAQSLARDLESNLERVRKLTRTGRKPRVYFEEWNDPLISGIGWVSELIEIAGGSDVFEELAGEPLAKQRIISDPSRVIDEAPDIIIGSWCGKPFRPEELNTRPGWDSIPAVKNGHVYEVDSSVILPPGPAPLTEGLAELQRIISAF